VTNKRSNCLDSGLFIVPVLGSAVKGFERCETNISGELEKFLQLKLVALFKALAWRELTKLRISNLRAED
jgi:hypothetical protein